jgi:aminoglycoside phosphotransferase family enzyme
MEVKCGGAVVKNKRMPQDVNFQNMKRKGKMKKMTIHKIKKKIS